MDVVMSLRHHEADQETFSVPQTLQSVQKGMLLVLCHTPPSVVSVHARGAGGHTHAAGSEPTYFLHPRKPEELKELAPGTNPPFLLFNKELKTDFIKIEEFLEQTLGPPT